MDNGSGRIVLPYLPQPTHTFVRILKANQVAQQVHGKVLRDTGEQRRCDLRGGNDTLGETKQTGCAHMHKHMEKAAFQRARDAGIFSDDI